MDVHDQHHCVPGWCDKHPHPLTHTLWPAALRRNALGLEPCPFCRSMDVEVQDIDEVRGLCYAVVCRGCGGQGPAESAKHNHLGLIGEAQQKATQLWNNWGSQHG